MVEYGGKIEEKVKAMQSETVSCITLVLCIFSLQRKYNEGKETGTQINDLEQKEEINIQLKQNEETRILKNEERLRNLMDKFKCSNI